MSEIVEPISTETGSSVSFPTGSTRPARFFRFRTIQGLLVFWFVTLVLLPGIVTGAALAVVGLQNGRQQAINQLESVARIKEAEIINWADDVQTDLLTALGGGQVEPRLQVFLQSAAPSESQTYWLRSHFQQVVAQAVRLDELFLLNAQGDVILSSDITREGQSHSGQPHVTEGAKGFYIEPPAYSSSDGQIAIFAALPVFGPEGQVLGVLAARVNPGTLAAIMGERAWLGDTGEVYLVDRNHILLADLRFDDRLYIPLQSGGVDAAITAQANGSGLYTDYRNDPVVEVHHWLPGLQVALVAQQHQAEAFRGTYVALGVIGASALVATLVAVFAALTLTPTIAAPLANLADVAARIAGGDLELTANVTREDEIGALAQAFNSMTARLRDLLTSERVARREAEEASRLKDLFLATMSHELRTPLNAIIGFLGLMLFSEQLDDDNVHMAERSIANAERLLSLINNILDLSRISSGRLEIIPVEVSPYDLAETIREDMELQVKEKDLHFVVEVDKTLPDTIIHDEERIIQIATNLVGNAIKFTDEGSIWLTFKRRGERLVIEVADTGIGIPPSKQQIIFDEFTQVDSSSTRKHSGAGLGLSIVKKLTILMRGSVRVSSEVGKGSTFTVELPLDLLPSEGVFTPALEGAA